VLDVQIKVTNELATSIATYTNPKGIFALQTNLKRRQFQKSKTTHKTASTASLRSNAVTLACGLNKILNIKSNRMVSLDC
jgi:hypothetical protein